MKYVIRREFFFALLLVISIGLIAWQHLGMNQHLVINISEQTPVRLLNDNVNGGRSIGVFKQSSDGIQLSCDTKLSATFAFCSILVDIERAKQGINLTGYSTLTLELTYESSQRDTLLVYLLNKERLNNTQLTRANLLTLLPKNGRSQYQVDLANIVVPSWWLFSRTENVTSTPMLNNVIQLQFSTGDNHQERHVDITVHRIEFTGKWISKQDLYLGILVLWILTSLIYLTFFALELNKKYQASRMQSRDLNSINSFLKIERDRYESLAKNDPLTGCLNRTGLRDVLSTVIKEYKEQGTPATLILLDLDFFKSVNDQYGHHEGDQVLKRLATLVHQHIRDTDRLIRWGGEEFAIVSSHTSLTGALTLAENLRRSISESPLCSHRKITASFGVAPLKSDQLDRWFKAADEALYRAKGAGRNCVKQ